MFHEIELAKYIDEYLANAQDCSEPGDYVETSWEGVRARLEAFDRDGFLGTDYPVAVDFIRFLRLAHGVQLKIAKVGV